MDPTAFPHDFGSPSGNTQCCSADAHGDIHGLMAQTTTTAKTASLC
jgi:hypothetical protein